VLAGAFLFAVLALGYLWALEDRLQWRQPLDPKAAAGLTVKNAPEGYAWERWSAEAVRQARTAGRPVVVDFTAKWCITCNSIVKPAFEREAVVAELKSRNVAALVADYSDYGADIAAAMKEFNRAAVPLVVVFPAEAGKAPIVLPDPNPILGPGAYATVIVEALRAAAK
jgi:thiol:disulfide interchange protein DsbD